MNWGLFISFMVGLGVMAILAAVGIALIAQVDEAAKGCPECNWTLSRGGLDLVSFLTGAFGGVVGIRLLMNVPANDAR